MIAQLIALALFGALCIVWMLWRMEYACHKTTAAQRDEFYEKYRALEERRAFDEQPEFPRPMSLMTGHIRAVPEPQRIVH